MKLLKRNQISTIIILTLVITINYNFLFMNSYKTNVNYQSTQNSKVNKENTDLLNYNEYQQALLSYDPVNKENLHRLLDNDNIIRDYYFYTSFPVVLISFMGELDILGDYKSLNLIKSYTINQENKVLPEIDSEMFSTLSQQQEDEPEPTPHEIIQADYLWDLGLEGSGIDVAVIDTGISSHSDLAGRIIYDESFITESNGYGSAEPETDDLNGHGTHVAGIIGGNGLSTTSVDARGVAPKVNLVNLKAATLSGSSTQAGILAAIQKAIELDVDIISISIGFPISSPNNPFNLAFDAAVDEGIVVVASAGNEGSQSFTMSSPANSYKSIAVGASDYDDDIAGFSSRGPTDDYRFGPDIVAPGVNVLSTLASGSATENFLMAILDFSTGTLPYVYLSGTSMSAPVVSGAIALLKQAFPNITPEEIMAGLYSTSDDLGYSIYTQGSGRINIKETYQVLDESEQSTGYEIVGSPIVKNGHLELFSPLDFNGDSSRVIIPYFSEKSSSLTSFEITGNISSLITSDTILIDEDSFTLRELNFTSSYKNKPGYYEGRISIEFGSLQHSINFNTDIKYPSRANVYWDIFHSGYSDSPEMSFKELNDILVSENIDVDIYNHPIAYHNLSRYNILVLTDIEVGLSYQEILDIKEFYENGGSVLLLGSFYPYFEPVSYQKLISELGFTTPPNALKNSIGVLIEDNILEKNTFGYPLNITNLPTSELTENVNKLTFTRSSFFDSETLVEFDDSIIYKSSDDTSLISSIIPNTDAAIVVADKGSDLKGNFIFIGTKEILSNGNMDDNNNINFAKNVFSYLIKENTPVVSYSVEEEVNEINVIVNHNPQIFDIEVYNSTGNLIVIDSFSENSQFDWDNFTIKELDLSVSINLSIILKLNGLTVKNFSIIRKTVNDSVTIENLVIETDNPTSPSPPSWLKNSDLIYTTSVLDVEMTLTKTPNQALFIVTRLFEAGSYEYNTPFQENISLFDLDYSEYNFGIDGEKYSISKDFSALDFSSGYYSGLILVYDSKNCLSDFNEFLFIIYDEDPSIDIASSTINGHTIKEYNEELDNDKLAVWSTGDVLEISIEGIDRENQLHDVYIHMSHYYLFLLDRTMLDSQEISKTGDSTFKGNYNLPLIDPYFSLEFMTGIKLKGEIFVLFIFIRDDSGNWQTETVFFTFDSTNNLPDSIFVVVMLFGAIGLVGAVIYLRGKSKPQLYVDQSSYYQSRIVRPAVSEPLLVKFAFCPNCGEKNEFESEYCPFCGKKYSDYYFQ